MIKIEKKNEKNEKNIWLQGESNPGLLACLAEALPLDQGVNWILAEKKLMQYDLWSQQIFVKILLTQETSTMWANSIQNQLELQGEIVSRIISHNFAKQNRGAKLMPNYILCSQAKASLYQ